MSKLTLSERILERLRKAPNRAATQVVRYLRSPDATSQPRCDEGSLYTEVINQVSYLIELMQDFKELSRLCDRFAEADEDYLPSYPPVSPVTNAFFYPHMFFDQAYGSARETLGQVCLQLGRAFSIHPQRLALLENLCQSRMGVYLHQGLVGNHIKLKDLLSGREFVAQSYSGYQGKAGDLLYARSLPSARGNQVEEMITTPYLLHDDLSEWQRYFERHPDALHLKHPPVWNYWLEFVFDGYVGHRDDAVFLEGLPDQAETRPHRPDSPSQAVEGCYSLSQRWSPAVVRESKKARPFRPSMLILVDEHRGTICKFDQRRQKWQPAEVADWLRRHALPPQGSQLWLDDSPLQAYLSEHLLDVQCELRESLPELERAMQSLSQHLNPDQPSVVEILGRSEALQLFRSAHNFFVSRPWKTLDSETALAFRDRHDRQWGLVVMGSGGQEFGLAVYSSPAEAQAAIAGEEVMPVLGFSSAAEYQVGAQDLDLIERENLVLPNGEYPWVFAPLTKTLSRTPLKDTEWLLRQVPRLAQNQHQPIEEQGLQLQLVVSPPSDLSERYAAIFLHYWGKNTDHAWQLADLLAHFATEKFAALKSSELQERMEALVAIGGQYLADQPRKKKLNLDYLRQLQVRECKFRPALASTAQLLRDFVRNEIVTV